MGLEKAHLLKIASAFEQLQYWWFILLQRFFVPTHRIFWIVVVIMSLHKLFSGVFFLDTPQVRGASFLVSSDYFHPGLLCIVASYLGVNLLQQNVLGSYAFSRIIASQ